MPETAAEERTAKEIITTIPKEDDEKGWPDCWICKDIFKRKTPT